jgi:hypothetical protein
LGGIAQAREGEVYIQITIKDENINLSNIRDLFDVLWQRGIIFISENNYEYQTPN